MHATIQPYHGQIFGVLADLLASMQEVVEAHHILAALGHLRVHCHDAGVRAQERSCLDVHSAAHTPAEGSRGAVRVLMEEQLQRQERAACRDPASNMHAFNLASCSEKAFNRSG